MSENETIKGLGALARLPFNCIPWFVLSTIDTPFIFERRLRQILLAFVALSGLVTLCKVQL